MTNNNLFEALEQYKQSTYHLAKVMSKIKTEVGRKTLEDITQLDTSKINTFCRLGTLAELNGKQLLPETLIEFYNQPLDIVSELLEVAKNKKASEIRKLIRIKTKTLHIEEKQIKVNNWAKNLMLLELNLNKLDKQTKSRAIKHIQSKLS